MHSGARRWLWLAAFPLLTACGGAIDIGFWWHGGACAVAPMVVSRPPVIAAVGQPYVYQLLFDMAAACGARPGQGSCFYVVPVQLPSGAVFDSFNSVVTWTPAPEQAGVSQAFEIATVTLDCDRRVSWAWTVSVVR